VGGQGWVVFLIILCASALGALGYVCWRWGPK